MGLTHSRLKGRKRTGVHPRNVLDWGEEEHEDDTHAKDLNAPAGHVEHEGLHGQGFGGGDGEVPCTLFFEGCVGRGSHGGCLGGRPRLFGGGSYPETRIGGDVRESHGGWQSQAVGVGFSICGSS